jgi:glycosyltransferase involved in cell wall biosynthesis
VVRAGRRAESPAVAALQSVAWADDIHVLDSWSEDRTVAIAEFAGAKVTRRVFDNWSAHQNWALRHLPFKHPWVFYLDADERMSPELAGQVRAAVAAPAAMVAFRVRRRDFLGTTWLRHVQASPFFLRLFRPERIRYERLVNPVSIAGPGRERWRGCA